VRLRRRQAREGAEGGHVGAGSQSPRLTFGFRECLRLLDVGLSVHGTDSSSANA
jgi:hypothetical protein